MAATSHELRRGDGGLPPGRIDWLSFCLSSMPPPPLSLSENVTVPEHFAEASDRILAGDV
jgi:hypothetical protein